MYHNIWIFENNLIFLYIKMDLQCRPAYPRGSWNLKFTPSEIALYWSKTILNLYLYIQKTDNPYFNLTLAVKFVILTNLNLHFQTLLLLQLQIFGWLIFDFFTRLLFLNPFAKIPTKVNPIYIP